MEERSSNTSHSDDDNRGENKLFVAIFAKECLELTIDCFNIWTFVDKEINKGDNINQNLQTSNSSHDNLNNKVEEIINPTNLVRTIKTKTSATSVGMF